MDIIKKAELSQEKTAEMLKKARESATNEKNKSESKSEQPKDSFDFGILGGVSGGERQNAAAQLTQKLFQNFPEKEWTIPWQLVKNWNSQNKPPLSEQELNNVYYDVKKNEKGKKGTEKPNNKGESEHLSTTFDIAPLGVIDILDDKGKLVYLTKDGIVHFVRDPQNPTQIFVPPPKDQCPYLFAQSDKVLELRT